MVFDFSVTSGTRYALASLVLGLVLGVAYDEFRLVRLILPRSAVITFFLDILFCLTAAASFMLVCFNFGSGEHRLFAFAGTAGAFLAYYATVGRVVYALSDRIVNVIKKPFRAIARVLRNAAELKKTRKTLQKAIHAASNGFGMPERIK